MQPNACAENKYSEEYIDGNKQGLESYITAHHPPAHHLP